MYLSIDNCLNDIGLKGLFNDDRVEECTIKSNDKLITKLPFTTWEYFTNRLASISHSLLSNHEEIKK